MLYEGILERIGFDEGQVADYHRYTALTGGRADAYAYAYMREGVGFTDSLNAVRTLVTDEVCQYTVDLLFLLECTGYLYEDYVKKGVSEEIFIQTMCDIKYKADECRAVKGVFGNFVAFWYDGFFKMTRFAFGRLQYDIYAHKHGAVEIGGRVINQGDFVLNCHIPSSGPLRHEDCVRSYKLAREFFAERLTDGILPVYCYSWLLYPEYQGEVFEVGSNTYAFAADFKIYKVEVDEVFNAAWRVFSVDYKGDTSVLPQNTRLQRNFVKYIERGGTFGSGFGMLLFDGEKFIK